MSIELKDILPSDFVMATLRIKGKPFSFKGRQYLKKAYDENHRNFIMRTGRQVEKSTTMAGKIINTCLRIPYFNAVYVAPTSKQTRNFSSQKISTFLNTSPFIRKYYMKPPFTVDRVFEKTFLNFSRIQLDYAYYDADTVRGSSGDMLCIDEIQDMLVANVPVLEEILSHSEHRLKLYAGTPKTFNSTIEKYWNNSSQTDWVVKCPSCGGWQIPGERNLKPDGLRCARCDALLDTNAGRWINMKDNAEFKGLHISQLIVPWKEYSEIWMKYTNYPREQFYNEVLGLPFSSSAMPVTEEELINASVLPPMTEKVPVPPDRKPYYMGLDWATQSGDVCFTTVVIGYLDGANFNIAYMKRFMGLESDQNFIFNAIPALAKKYKVRYIGADWGIGSGGGNTAIRNAMKSEGYDPLIEFYYSHNSGKFATWDPNGWKYVVNRTRSLANLFRGIKTGAVRFPEYESWKSFAADFFNITVEATTKTRVMFFNKIPDTTDDIVHACNYAYLASLVGTGQISPYVDITSAYT